jgi:hypothetical protein
MDPQACRGQLSLHRHLADLPVSRISDGIQIRPEPRQTVIPHGPDRDLIVAEVLSR